MYALAYNDDSLAPCLSLHSENKNKRYNLSTFRRLHDAIIKGTNENKINKCEIKSYN